MSSGSSYKWGFPKIRGTILGVPIIRTIVFWGLYWGPLILGMYQMNYLHIVGWTVGRIEVKKLSSMRLGQSEFFGGLGEKSPINILL